MILTPPYGIAQAPPLTQCRANPVTGSLFAASNLEGAGSFSGFALVGSQIVLPGDLTQVTADATIDVNYIVSVLAPFGAGYANASVSAHIDLTSLDDDLMSSEDLPIYNAHAAWFSGENDSRTRTLSLACMIRRAATTRSVTWQVQVAVETFGFAAGVASAQAFGSTVVSSIIVK